MLQFGVFWTNGQICSSTSRLLVQEGIAPAFYEQLKKRAESIKQCDPMTQDCRMGPVVSQDQLDKIMGFIQASLSFNSFTQPTCMHSWACVHASPAHLYKNCSTDIMLHADSQTRMTSC